MGPRLPVGLDFGAIMIFGAAMGAPEALLADVLPLVETAILDAYRNEADSHGD